MPYEKCPYCQEDVRIEHDDGYGLAESEPHQHECSHCGKTFVYYTTISIDHDVRKADCLNGICDHNYEKSRTYPPQFARMICTMCGDQKVIPEEHRA
jgi:5-methylcytosine-specific restriction endonuclease McrA